jgi:hypothetical protein
VTPKQTPDTIALPILPIVQLKKSFCRNVARNTLVTVYNILQLGLRKDNSKFQVNSLSKQENTDKNSSLNNFFNERVASLC